MTSCSKVEDAVVVRMPPLLNMLNFPDLKRWLEENCVKSERKIIMDFSGVESLDSRALGELISMQRSLSEFGGKLIISSPSDKIRRILDVTSLDKILIVTSSLKEALGVKL